MVGCASCGRNAVAGALSSSIVLKQSMIRLTLASFLFLLFWLLSQEGAGSPPNHSQSHRPSQSHAHTHTHTHTHYIPCLAGSMEEFDDALRAPGADGTVNLSHRAYVTLDEQLWSWGAKVAFLNLAYNHIKFLDEGLGNLTHVHTLDVSNNALQALPAEIGGCVRLRVVRLNGNQLTKLPEEITDCKLIEELYVSENRITTLPKKIGTMLCLRKLNLANNNLKRLDCSIAGCTVLDDIDVSNNPIHNVPEELRGDSAMILWIMRFEFGAL